ncbi:uncharacterized protein [Branchiostoma lanceolatum]|uniref:uncharacterized protein isoform X2 n=1 Tax=Branchiostoma lanceolatum TaxID=7740 RepID=UPI003455B127
MNIFTKIVVLIVLIVLIAVADTAASAALQRAIERLRSRGKHALADRLERRRGDILGLDCPKDQPAVHCPVNPCDKADCRANQDAKCEPNYCGDCHAFFYDADGNRVDCDGCPDDQPPVNCFADPCTVTTCPANPDATCVSNYCGGCNADFFNRDGEPVCCEGVGQPCDTGSPHATEDDRTCPCGLLCFPNQDDFTTGTCQTQQWVDDNGGMPILPIG